jgi:hypothetical protein
MRFSYALTIEFDEDDPENFAWPLDGDGEMAGWLGTAITGVDPSASTEP